MGDFVEALEASRLNQDISKAVYEQLIALDDFVTFKKLMVYIQHALIIVAPYALLCDMIRTLCAADIRLSQSVLVGVRLTTQHHDT